MANSVRSGWELVGQVLDVSSVEFTDDQGKAGVRRYVTVYDGRDARRCRLNDDVSFPTVGERICLLARPNVYRDNKGAAALSVFVTGWSPEDCDPNTGLRAVGE